MDKLLEIPKWDVKWDMGRYSEGNVIQKNTIKRPPM